MIQLRPGDLVEVASDQASVAFAILTKEMLFGGHWCFVFRQLPTDTSVSPQPGFNAFVDFIVPKREGRIARISRGNDFSTLQGPELLQQEPLKGQVNYRIFRWKHKSREDVEYLRFTDTPTDEERVAPSYSCMPADYVCALVARRWKPGTSKWVA
jgi:hypothetical protein